MCDPCEENDCDENAECVAMALNYKCVCKPGYRDEAKKNDDKAGRKCIPTESALRPDAIQVGKQKEQNKMCHLAQPDIYFLVDFSRTVTRESLAYIVSFIREVIKEFTVSESDAQFGLATFAAKFKE